MEQEIEEEKQMETDSSSSSDEDDKENERRAEELEKQLSENAYLYDVHVELVDVYRKLSDLTSMRSAYERFYKYFPLTPKLWLDWLQDEIKIISENDRILKLFDNAVEDYQSVKVWQEYAQFAIGKCSVEEARKILDRGLNAVGLHVSEGSLLWDTLRELELAHLLLAKPDSESFHAQLLRIAEVFRRQLSVPLLDMESTYIEWQTFLKQLPEDHGIDLKPLDWGYEQALKALDIYKPFETQLLEAADDTELYNVYKEYIKAVKDPSLILCIYERAVAQLCLNTTLWEEYCYYSLKLGDLALKVSSRALRNCPWCVDLWIIRLKIFEQLQKPEGEVMKCFEEAVASVTVSQTLDLWLAYLEYIKRCSNDLERLNKLFNQAHQQLGFISDPTSKIIRFQARLMARNNNMQTARKLWSEILHIPQNKVSGNIWMEYLALEKQFGDPQHVRTLFKRAISSCKDWQQFFAEEWLMYEREVGTLQEVFTCLDTCKKYIKPVNNTQYEQQESYSNSVNRKKRNYDHEENKGKTHFKKQKVYENEKSMDNTHSHRGNLKRDWGKAKEEFNTYHKSPIKIVGPPVDLIPEKTAFISNLQSKVTEEKLKEFFPNSIKITIPTDRRGHPRCYAYVQFENEEETEKAIKRDREPIDGRPMFISVCKPDRSQRQTVFKYSDKMEYNKLFVKGLPKHYTMENIEAIFKPYGATEIRLVNKFNGLFKGLAYVDFANDEDAEKALKNTDQMAIGEYTISVAISAPPSKKKEFNVPAKQPTRNSKSRLEIPFVPRSVKINKGSDEVQNISKTNDDFRKMLLEK